MPSSTSASASVPSHLSVERAGIRGDASKLSRHGRPRGTDVDGTNSEQNMGLISFARLGHAARGGIAPYENLVPAFGNPVVDEYFQEKYRLRRERENAANEIRAGGFGGNIFPHMSFHSHFPRTILVSHPQGPTATEHWRWFLVDRDTPDEVKDFLRRFYIQYSGPGGMTEQDDMENWNYATEASRGVIARRYPYNYQMGLGHARPVEELPGAVDSGYWVSEENARSLLRRWQDLMECETWGEIAARAAEGLS